MYRKLRLLLGALALMAFVGAIVKAADEKEVPKTCKFVKVDAGKVVMTVKVETGKTTKEMSLPLSDKLKIAGGKPKVTKVEDIRPDSTILLNGDADGKVTFIYITKEPEKGI